MFADTPFGKEMLNCVAYYRNSSYTVPSRLWLSQKYEKYSIDHKTKVTKTMKLSQFRTPTALTSFQGTPLGLLGAQAQPATAAKMPPGAIRGHAQLSGGVTVPVFWSLSSLSWVWCIWLSIHSYLKERRMYNKVGYIFLSLERHLKARNKSQIKNAWTLHLWVYYCLKKFQKKIIEN